MVVLDVFSSRGCQQSCRNGDKNLRQPCSYCKLLCCRIAGASIMLRYIDTCLPVRVSGLGHDLNGTIIAVRTISPRFLPTGVHARAQFDP